MTALMLVLPFVLGGCGGDSSKTGGPRTRLIVLENGHSPYWDVLNKGIAKAAAEFKVKADFEPNDATPEGQLQKLQQFGSQSDIAAIAISATDAANAAIAEELKKLAAQGIKVVCVDADMDRNLYRDRRFGFVGTDNVQAGEELGKAAKNLAPDGAKYVTFVGRPASQNALDRSAGFKKGAGEKFELLDNMADKNDRNLAEENVRNATINHPELSMLVGIWSYNAPAIVKVVNDIKGRDKYKILTFDAEAIAIEHMVNGQIDAMLVQDPFEMGYQTVRLMKALVEEDKATIGKMFPNHGKTDGDLYNTGVKIVVPNDSPLKAEMFDKGTTFMRLDEFRKWLKERNLESS